MSLRIKSWLLLGVTVYHSCIPVPTLERGALGSAPIALQGEMLHLTTECGDPFAWEDLLPQALFALRTAVCKSTGLAPCQILFGRECSTPIDSIFRFVPPERALGNLGWEQYYQKLKRRIGSVQDYAQKHLTLAVRRQRRQYHQE